MNLTAQNRKQPSVSLILARTFGVLALMSALAAGQARAGEIDWTARDLGGVYKMDIVATKDSAVTDFKKGDTIDVNKLELVKASEKKCFSYA